MAWVLEKTLQKRSAQTSAAHDLAPPFLQGFLCHAAIKTWRGLLRPLMIMGAGSCCMSAVPLSLIWTPPQPPFLSAWEIEVDVEKDFPGLINFKEYILELVDECKEKEPEACEKHPPIMHQSKVFMLNRYWFVKDEGTKVSNEDETQKKIERKGYKQDLASSMIGGAEVAPAVKDKKDDAHLKAFKQVLKQLGRW